MFNFQIVIFLYYFPIILQTLTPVDFSRNVYYEPKFRFYDQSLYDAVRNGDRDVHMFFRHLALCHTVMADERLGTFTYFYYQLLSSERFVKGSVNISHCIVTDRDLYKYVCVMSCSFLLAWLLISVSISSLPLNLGSGELTYDRVYPPTESLILMQYIYKT